jgi:hypothetical protein
MQCEFISNYWLIKGDGDKEAHYFLNEIFN